jgi:hypothetical protein
MACNFAYTTTFNVAHWLLAFSYLALSYRIELIAKKLPEDIHNYKLGAINTLVCLINVAAAALYWYFSIGSHPERYLIPMLVE